MRRKWPRAPSRPCAAARRHAHRRRYGRAALGRKLGWRTAGARPLDHRQLFQGRCAAGQVHRRRVAAHGDVATLDAEGYMRISDRTKDLIKSGGEWISSVDLENAVMGHPAVAEAAVIAIPHPKWDERPLAVVVRKPGQSVTAEALASISSRCSRSGWSRTITRSSMPCLRPRPASSSRPGSGRLRELSIASLRTADGPELLHRSTRRRGCGIIAASQDIGASK